MEQVRETGFWQWFAVLFGVAEVCFALYDRIWLYPAGIISTIISIYLLLTVQLYADATLNVYYFVMSVYGWITWKKRADGPPLQISYANKTEWAISLAISFGGLVVLYYLLKFFTTSSVPLWDAWVSSTAWAGMWLLAKRKIENWVFLNISNVFAIPLLFYKQLPLFAALTIFLFCMAFAGYFKWRNIYRSSYHLS